MIDPIRFFEDLFNEKNITTLRLYNFCANTLNILTAANAGGEFTDLIKILTPLVTQLGTELGEVASSTAEQKGGTLTNDQVMASFQLTMSTKAGVIQDIFGGEKTPGFLMFYPQGRKQYSGATKTTMPTLVKAVFAAADKYKTELGPTLTATLQSYQDSWAKSRDAQQQLKGDVKSNIADKSGLRPQLSIAATKVMHGIAYMFPGDVHTCMAYFDFTILYPQKHHKHEIKKGDVAPGETVTVVNEMLEESETVSFFNPTANALMAGWLAPDEKSPYPGNGVEFLPGKTVNVKAPELGDLKKNTFLRVINLSDVNEGGYEVTIS